jgi:TRAP-type mannitol/chloroaromatic compound transport system substrate-binding protein
LVTIAGRPSLRQTVGPLFDVAIVGKDASMRSAIRLVALFSCAFASLATASAGKRVALVIGNADYKIGRLANPVNDAEAVAEAFKSQLKLDKVILRKDLKRDGFGEALREMARESSAAELGVVFFAGHGIEVGGRNYLVPIDAVLAAPADIELEAIALDSVLRQLDGITKLRLVILDACRNNPFPAAKRSGTRGLSRVEPDGGTLIAYAAKDGTTADDGKGRHSPFTAALLKRIVTPGLDVRLVFGYISEDVKTATGHNQVPYLYGQLGGEQVHLIPASAIVSPPPVLAQPGAAAEAWDRTKDTTSIAVLEAYIRRFGDTFYGDLAKARLAELKQAETAKQAAAKKKADEDARAKAEADRQHLALLRLAEERKRAEAEATRLEELKKKQASQAVQPGLAASAPFRLTRPVRWRLATTFPKSLPVFVDAIEDAARALSSSSGSTLQIDVMPAGAVVPPFEVLDATHKRIIDAAWSIPGYWAGKHKSMVLFGGNVPFGLSASTLVRWMDAEGADLMQHVYSQVLKLKVQSLPCGVVGASSDWFKQEILSSAELLKRRFRATGFPASVGQRAGISVVNMPGGEIIPALERGVIDGASWATPLHGVQLGLPGVTKVLYYPGWSQPASLLELLINEDNWRELGASAQSAVRTVCRRNLHAYLSKILDIERKGLDEARARGVKILTYPASVLEPIRTAVLAELDNAAQADREFAKVLASYNRYR